MKTIKIDANAKINLSLDVLRKREDNYHELKMIMQQIDLKDTITIERLSNDSNNIEINCNHSNVPTDEKNIVHQAIKLLTKKFNIKSSIRVSIEKNIPVAGGLAGGSTDAAAVLKGLNKLFDLNLSEDELKSIGVELGADVPFCIVGGTALCEGIGEKITKLTPFKDRLILLANPNIEVLAANVYKNLDLDSLKDRPDIDKVMKLIEKGDTNSLSKHMRNVLESVTTKDYPIVEVIKEYMIEQGALGSIMSGSGPTVFGIFDDEKVLVECMKDLENKGYQTITTKTI